MGLCCEPHRLCRSSEIVRRLDNALELDLSGPGYHINRQDQLVIESAPVRAGEREPDVPEDPFARFSNRRSHDGPAG